MITAHTINGSGQFEALNSAEGEALLRVRAPTAGKEQLMVYVKFDRQSDSGVAKLSMDMADPKIDNGSPFKMCRLEGSNVVPVEFNLVQSGLYRVPVPAGSNENSIFVNAEIVNGDPEKDSLEFWVALNAYQPVSGLVQ